MNRFYALLQKCWDWRAAGNFMFGGTGSALLLLVVFAFPEMPPLLLGLAALGFIGLGLFLVWLEIGRPWRFMNTFFHPQTSWMTREALVAFVLFPVALAGIFFEIPLLIGIAGLLGLVFLYCQARILRAAKGIPAWRSPDITRLIVTTGLVEGTSAALIATPLLGAGLPAWVLYLLIALLAVRIYFWHAYRKNLLVTKAPLKTLEVLSGINGFTLWLGNGLPLFLGLVALLMPGAASLLVPLAALLALLSGWSMKFVIVVRAAQQQGYGFGKLSRGRPKIVPPQRRKPDRFVF